MAVVVVVAAAAVAIATAVAVVEGVLEARGVCFRAAIVELVYPQGSSRISMAPSLV